MPSPPPPKKRGGSEDDGDTSSLHLVSPGRSPLKTPFDAVYSSSMSSQCLWPPPDNQAQRRGSQQSRHSTTDPSSYPHASDAGTTGSARDASIFESWQELARLDGGSAGTIGSTDRTSDPGGLMYPNNGSLYSRGGTPVLQGSEGGGHRSHSVSPKRQQQQRGMAMSPDMQGPLHGPGPGGQDAMFFNLLNA